MTEKKSYVLTKLTNVNENYMEKLEEVTSYLNTETNYVLGKNYS